MTSEDTLLEGGLHFDDLNKLRVIEPETAQQTAELKDQCQEFVDSKLLCINLKIESIYMIYYCWLYVSGLC